MLRFLIFLCGAVWVWPAVEVEVLAQQEFFRKSHKALEEGNRLLSVDLFRQAVKEYPQYESMLLQQLPLVSDYQPIIAFEDTVEAPAKNKEYVESIKSQIDSCTSFNAIEKIVELAKNQKIVILNEAHDMPQHRAFGLLLAKALRKAGFDYLAVETFALPWGIAGPVKFKYPTLETGHYSTEPVFGDFLRQANNMGYKMVAYEISMLQRSKKPTDQYDSILTREVTQAENIIKHVLEKDKNARLFMFVGYAHATENWKATPDGRELGWLAAQLKKKTGIDPLTIDQVSGSYNPKSNQIDPVFNVANEKFKIESPIVVTDKDDALVTTDNYHGAIDLSIFHPVQKMKNGRPDWLRMNGYRKEHSIENQMVFQDQATLVQAFLTDEVENKLAIPIDQVLVESVEGKSTLLLPAGTYTLKTSTIDGEIKTIGNIEITE